MLRFTLGVFIFKISGLKLLSKLEKKPTVVCCETKSELPFSDGIIVFTAMFFLLCKNAVFFQILNNFSGML